jgi:hypothetical protein
MEIYQASLSGVLRIIFWLFVISFIIRLIARLALPIVVKKASQVMNEKARQHSASQSAPRQEGEIRVEKMKATPPASDQGDYVDFVEIRE